MVKPTSIVLAASRLVTVEEPPPSMKPYGLTTVEQLATALCMCMVVQYEIWSRIKLGSQNRYCSA